MTGQAAGYGAEPLHDTQGIGGLCFENGPFGQRRGQRPLPCRVVVAWFHPACRQACGIVVLAAVDAAVSHGAFRRAPRCVGDDRFPAAVLVFERQFENHFGIHVTRQPFVIAFPGNTDESVAEHHTQRIAPLPQQRGYFERNVVHEFVVVRGCRIEQAVADFSAIEEVEMPEPRDVGYGLFQGFADFDLTAELRKFVPARIAVAEPFPKRCGVGRTRNQPLLFGHQLHGDPLCALPVLLIQQSYSEPGRFAPRGGFSGRVVDADAPIIKSARTERRPRIGNMQRLRTAHLSAVPQAFPLFAELLRGIGNADFVGLLDESLPLRCRFPTEFRGEGVHGQRIFKVFALQFIGGKGTCESFGHYEYRQAEENEADANGFHGGFVL